MQKNQVDIITMGCSKNLVDSEVLYRLFEEHGYECKHDPEVVDGEIAVVNTCGFIESAKEESINMILKLVESKSQGRLKKLFVMGCLSERYKKELEAEIPQVDKFYGKFNYKELLVDLGKSSVPSCNGKRHITTPRHYAYLKISEGCDRKCAYCAIPLITGKHRSRPKDEILSEVKDLVSNGVKEFQIIAQELTYYGLDITGKREIADLVRSISEVPGVKWIRLHYAYPNQFPLDLLDVMREKDNVCNYIDIALQHISDNVLNRMHRNISKQETIDLIKTMRERVPNIHIRTTMMVGFPGETEEDFQELVEFVKWAKFERMGAFAYSEEEGTFSAENYQDDISEELKNQRLDELMAVQQDISKSLAEMKVGKTFMVVIDRKENDFYVGRTEFSSPEVDPEVLIKSDKELQIGSFYKVHVVDSDEFDLYAEIIDE